MRLRLTKPTALIAPVVARYFIVAVALLSPAILLLRSLVCCCLFLPTFSVTSIFDCLV
ncbi:Uncharacterised protein [Vibrio cholerae]|uniref:Uncharacterized protein n=1 Tax=Vibrio cholerae TaxID=666 RepID=A0A655XXG1_VIBCL|nr:Uncharacterised protein [Vibrio cholerae]CSB34597.1 Uncharacterised protein [Vibrio cholerae]CSC01701.1 Uncharacterised protein [Vibrio cholerae]CSC22968.1 Uncharacterised protein [Vibrio cholerae]CSC29769.1 Uncharacterised protein [Vibrio cholerae]